MNSQDAQTIIFFLRNTIRRQCGADNLVSAFYLIHCVFLGNVYQHFYFNFSQLSSETFTIYILRLLGHILKIIALLNFLILLQIPNIMNLFTATNEKLIIIFPPLSLIPSNYVSFHAFLHFLYLLLLAHRNIYKEYIGEFMPWFAQDNLRLRLFSYCDY